MGKRKLLKDEDVISYLKSLNIPEEKYLCKDCGKLIKWNNTEFNIATKTIKNSNVIHEFGDLRIRGNSFNNKRIYNGHEYHLSYCYECACKRFPDIPDKKFPLQPASFRAKTLFCINDEDFNGVVDNISRRTEENYIKKFGEEEGLKKWKTYCEKQAYTNSFEYKQKKYGWTKEEYDKFNSSRSCTLKHFIERHGEEEGLKRWENYCERQRYTNSLDYFKKEYGEIEGTKKFELFCKTRLSFGLHSNMADNFCENLAHYFKGHKLHFATLNEEYKIGKYALDYYDEDLKIGVEFYGDFWHFNPLYYDEDDIVEVNGIEMKVKNKWDQDEKRIKLIEEKLNCKIFIIWEKEYKKNKNKSVENLYKQIKEYIKLHNN